MMSSTNKLSVLQPIPYMGQVDNLSTDSQPDPTETLDVGLPTSIVHIKVLIIMLIKIFQVAINSYGIIVHTSSIFS